MELQVHVPVAVAGLYSHSEGFEESALSKQCVLLRILLKEVLSANAMVFANPSVPLVNRAANLQVDSGLIAGGRSLLRPSVRVRVLYSFSIQLS